MRLKAVCLSCCADTGDSASSAWDSRALLADDWGHDHGWGGGWGGNWNGGWNSGWGGGGGGNGGSGNSTNDGHCTDANWCWGFCAGAPAPLPVACAAAGPAVWHVHTVHS